MSNDLAVVFDMDGVLVDSYRAHFESWQAVAVEEGLSVTEEEFAITFGRTSREIIAALWGEDRYTLDESVALDDRKEAAFRDIVRDDFPAMPGAVKLLEALAGSGFELAVGSSGPPANIKLVLDRLGCRDLFGATITGMDVTRGKPDPQVFLLAAQRLGIEPPRCAVVEDAPAGVAAANSAGMTSIGLASTGRERHELCDARLVVDSLNELSPTTIRELILGR
jgi:HAD superfamily hydrolase (TIGR01509 family)